MKHFWKAILLSLRYKWSLLFSVVNAMLIAALWGLSIWTIYPFVEVIFQGKTLHDWVDARVVQASTETHRLETEIATLRQQPATAPPDKQVDSAREIRLRQDTIQLHQKSIQFYHTLRPYMDRWLPRTPFGSLVLTVVFLVAATILKGICLVLNTYLVCRVANATTADLRRTFFRAMLRMDQRKIDSIGTSNLMTMLTHNVQLVQQGLAGIYGKSIREPLKIVACLVGACLISWQLLVISLLIAPLGSFFVHFLSKRMKQAVGREIEGMGTIFQTLMETLNGIKVVRIFTRQRTHSCRFKQNVSGLYRAEMKIAVYDSLIRPVTELAGILVVAVAMLCGAYLVLNHQTHLFGLRISRDPLSAAKMFVFFAMLAGIADPARKLTDIYNVLIRAAMGSDILFTAFEAPHEVGVPAVPRQLPAHRQSLRFENVTFGYHPESPVLHNISLEIPHGQTVALVGANGSGKSSFMNLVARFYDPQQGRVLLDGVDLREVRPRQLCKQLGIVPQDPFLFNGTIEMNIRYGNVDASDEEVRRAAELAQVTSFLRDLPQGLQTQVGDWGNFLSGGQRQRVALARAILSDPQILILDEPTSQVDIPTEKLLHETLRDYLSRRTVLLVTHRVSTLVMADRVIFLEGGRIVEDVCGSNLDLTCPRLALLHAKAA